MRAFIKLILLVVLLIAAFAAAGYWYVTSTELSARASPSPVESKVARRIRTYAVPARVKATPNPVPATPEIVRAGMTHFADHCATCHGNDGAGDTMYGRGMYPRPPDLKAAATQAMTDGELFHVIENGVRFTGMPGFGDGSAEASNDTWHLVRFIRHLPKITKTELAEMAALNPKSPEEWTALQLGKEPAKASDGHKHKH
ncbi:MAG TPA: cytochrome c [Vicinamibacterales bacterium]|jgi:mono/diheme cytochrome c family protein|nr:cytochrome c [Vicinamibacterales bacterium]